MTEELRTDISNKYKAGELPGFHLTLFITVGIEKTPLCTMFFIHRLKINTTKTLNRNELPH